MTRWARAPQGQRLRSKLLISTIGALFATSIVAVGQANAYHYDWSCYDAPYNWCIRDVAHNYNHHSVGNQSASTWTCSKLIRNSDGTNYGSVYCGAGSAGAYYAGDTGTKPLAYQENTIGGYYTLTSHDDW